MAAPKRTLDKTRHYCQIYGSAQDDGAVYVQDDIRFRGDGEEASLEPSEKPPVAPVAVSEKPPVAPQEVKKSLGVKPAVDDGIV